MSDFSAVHSTSARPASLNDFMVISERRMSGWTMIGSAFLSGAFGAGQRAALEAVLGVGGGVLVGDLAERQALQADAETRLVHHGEHRLQAAIRLAEQRSPSPRRNS